MVDVGAAELPLDHEHRLCWAPTAARVRELLDPLSRSVVSHRGQVLTVVAPILSTLDVRLRAYGPVAPRRGNAS